MKGFGNISTHELSVLYKELSVGRVLIHYIGKTVAFVHTVMTGNSRIANNTKS